MTYKYCGPCNIAYICVVETAVGLLKAVDAVQRMFETRFQRVSYEILCVRE